VEREFVTTTRKAKRVSPGTPGAVRTTLRGRNIYVLPELKTRQRNPKYGMEGAAGFANMLNALGEAAESYNSNVNSGRRSPAVAGGAGVRIVPVLVPVPVKKDDDEDNYKENVDEAMENLLAGMMGKIGVKNVTKKNSRRQEPMGHNAGNYNDNL
jgi:hypothetical protein